VEEEEEEEEVTRCQLIKSLAHYVSPLFSSCFSPYKSLFLLIPFTF
jgi:hypothetical protein